MPLIILLSNLKAQWTSCIQTACQKSDKYLQTHFAPKFGKNVKENIAVKFTRTMIEEKEQNNLKYKQGCVFVDSEEKLYNFFKSLCESFFSHICLKDIKPNGKQMDIYPQTCCPAIRISLTLSSLNVSETNTFSKITAWDFDYEGFTEEALMLPDFLQDMSFPKCHLDDEEVDEWLNALDQTINQEEAMSTNQIISEEAQLKKSGVVPSNAAPSQKQAASPMINASTTGVMQLSNNDIPSPSRCVNAISAATPPSSQEILPDFNNSLENLTTILNQLSESGHENTNVQGNPQSTTISSFLRNVASKEELSSTTLLPPSTTVVQKSPLHALYDYECAGKAARKRSMSESPSSNSEDHKKRKIESLSSSSDCSSNDEDDEVDKTQELKNIGFNIEGGSATSFRNFLGRKERKLYDDTQCVFAQNVKKIHDSFAIIMNWINTLQTMLDNIPFEMNEETGQPVITCRGCIEHCPAKIKMKARKGRPKKENLSQYNMLKKKKTSAPKK